MLLESTPTLWRSYLDLGYNRDVPRRSATPDSRHSARSRSEYQRCLPLLREIREKKKVSQAELGRRLGKPQSWVDKCESGQRRVDFVEFIQIAEALGVSPVTLINACRRRVGTQ
ncbi:MAG: helix-turn-helix transcriptional regulator [Thermoanaerobaculia bacterium]